MEFKARVIAPRAVSARGGGLDGLALVRSGQPNRTHTNPPPPAAPRFSAAEMRHNLAIWPLPPDGVSRRRLHLYYCIRCKWAFRVDDRSGSVTPVDTDGKPIQGAEAAERLATFSAGPCAAFKGLTGERRLTQTIPTVASFREQLAAFLLWMVATAASKCSRRPSSSGV